MSQRIVLDISSRASMVRVRALREGARLHGLDWVDARDIGIAAAGLAIRRGRVRFAVRCGMQRRDAALASYCEHHGVPVLVLDLGFLRRSFRDGDGGYYQTCWGDLCAPAPASHVDGSRWDALGLEHLPQRRDTGRGTVLVCGQVPGDSQHHLTAPDLWQWLVGQVALEGWSRRHVRYRPHPAAGPAGRKNPASGWVEQFPAQTPLDAALAAASVVVCYNSTVGIDAMLAGRPVSCHPSAHYAAAAAGDDHDRRRHLHRLACSQWTADELSSGVALDYLMALPAAES